MLTNLHVKNLALIEETEINFKEGLNILTGETGAGKSIILGSINLALGGKASNDVIRKGEEYALTELTFEINGTLRDELRELGVEDIDDGIVIVSRKIMPTRSVFRVNGMTFTAAQVKRIAQLLLDIHGQHDNEMLLHENLHLSIVDTYGGEAIATIKSSLKEAYDEYRAIKKELEENEIDNDSRLREISFLQFEINEIVDAGLMDNEDIELENQYKLLTNIQKIREQMSIVDNYIVTGEENASGFVDVAIRALNSALSYDNKLGALSDVLNQIESLMGDASIMITDYLNNTDFDEEEFDNIQNRLNLINNLKMKYGNSIDDINDYLKQQKDKLEKLTDYENHKSSLKQSLENIKAKVDNLCSRLSKERMAAADRLCKGITKALLELNFTDVLFKADFSKTGYTYNGYDDMRFMIKPNPGEDIKPLSKTASGGELSRIMLAIKTVIANQDHIETLIFDEIDSGISGKTAQLVAGKLSQLSKTHQIICITHLPQIASMSDEHFLIQKSFDNKRTTTSIKALSEEEVICELARLLGGIGITNAAIENAKDIRKQAKDFKSKINIQ